MTDAEVRTMRCAQCATCVNGPTPDLIERTVCPEGEPVAVMVPKCMGAGFYYLKARMVVCDQFREWTQ